MAKLLEDIHIVEHNCQTLWESLSKFELAIEEEDMPEVEAFLEGIKGDLKNMRPVIGNFQFAAFSKNLFGSNSKEEEKAGEVLKGESSSKSPVIKVE